MSSGPHQLTPEGPRPSRPRLGHLDPSSPIEKHFVLQPILYAGYQHIIIIIASYYHAQELTRRAKQWRAKLPRPSPKSVLLPGVAAGLQVLEQSSSAP